jgi:4-diphosphocytidyl-2-C-methyl-D-erythritol kinase
MYPNAKINLGLQVVGKRDDGFHNLETIFLPIVLHDIIEILPNQPKELSFSSTGLFIPSNTENNLCVKAFQILKRDFNHIPNLSVHLHKQIAMGAGLGGGSANGSFVLKAINEIFNLGITEQQLINYALELGSDCPFFIINKPCYATGRGENLLPINLPQLINKKIVVINPNIHINTGWAFSNLVANQPNNTIPKIIQEPIESWKKTLINHFETSVFAAHPSIEKIKEKLYQLGALYASLTGTGSTVYGIFNDAIIEDILQEFDTNYLKLITTPLA